MAEEEQADSRQPASPQDRMVSVKVESAKGPYEVNLTAVNHLFTDIAKYNEKFSLGSMMARQIFSIFPMEGDEPRVPKGPGGEEEHQQMTASALNIIHQNTLEQIGLSLEPVSGKKATLMGLGEVAGEGEMRANVINRNRFTSFLGALTPEVVETTGLKSGLESLSGVLAQQIFDHYNLQKPSDEMLELFGGLGNIVNEYKRLGMGKKIENLATYLQHARQGDLREFVVIERDGLFSEPGKFFGPADWQMDSTSQGPQERWNRALSILQLAKNNPNARELYEKLGNHLLNCIKIARASTSLPKLHAAESKKVLENSHMRLEEMILHD